VAIWIRAHNPNPFLVTFLLPHSGKILMMFYILHWYFTNLEKNGICISESWQPVKKFLNGIWISETWRLCMNFVKWHLDLRNVTALYKFCKISFGFPKRYGPVKILLNSIWMSETWQPCLRWRFIHDEHVN
jgi:hypothetical protein